MANPASYLATLRRIPDDIILAIAAQDFDEGLGSRCVCGWAFREALGRELGIDPASAQAYEMAYGDSYNGCASRFGGTAGEWWDLYHDASFRTGDVETAFVDRLNEIVRVRPRKPAPRRRSRARRGTSS